MVTYQDRQINIDINRLERKKAQEEARLKKVLSMSAKAHVTNIIKAIDVKIAILKSKLSK